MIPFEDQCIEGVYDVVFKTCPPDDRRELARLLLRVALYKEQQMRERRTARAVERYRASTRDGGLHTADPAAGVSPAQPGGEGSEQ